MTDRNALADRLESGELVLMFFHPEDKFAPIYASDEQNKTVLAALRQSPPDDSPRPSKPVAYRWRVPGNSHWICDPTPEWVEDHKHEIELEPLYLSPAPTAAPTLEGEATPDMVIAGGIAIAKALKAQENDPEATLVDVADACWKAMQPLAALTPPGPSAGREIYWEDIAHLFCSCGKDNCNAAEHAPDHGLSPDGYAKRYGCESQEIYETAQRIAAWINKKFALSPSRPEGGQAEGCPKCKQLFPCECVSFSPSAPSRTAEEREALAGKCHEVLDWHATGTLVDGLVRERAKAIKADQGLMYHQALAVAEKEVADEAMRAALAPRSVAETTQSNEIETAMFMLGDVPGKTLCDRVQRLVSYHIELQLQLTELKATSPAPSTGEREIERAFQVAGTET